MSAPVKTSVDLGQRFAANRPMIKGEGKPLVFIHGPFGQEWSGALETLSASRQVIAPSNVGAYDMDELSQMDGILDLVLYYDELFDRLGLESFDLVGHSFGGMVAAEYAAMYPNRVNKLVLVGSLGLWDETRPVADYNYATPDQRQALMFRDPKSAEVQALDAAMPEDQAGKVAFMLDRLIALASTNHFLWPIPERGLRKRLDRIKAPTLLLWGEEDAVVPTAYMQDFAAGIRNTQTVLIDQAGHSPQVEQPHATAKAILDFLG